MLLFFFADPGKKTPKKSQNFSTISGYSLFLSFNWAIDLETSGGTRKVTSVKTKSGIPVHIAMHKLLKYLARYVSP